MGVFVCPCGDKVGNMPLITQLNILSESEVRDTDEHTSDAIGNDSHDVAVVWAEGDLDADTIIHLQAQPDGATYWADIAKVAYHPGVNILYGSPDADISACPRLRIAYQAISTPTSGALSVWLTLADL